MTGLQWLIGLAEAATAAVAVDYWLTGRKTGRRSPRLSQFLSRWSDDPVTQLGIVITATIVITFGLCLLVAL